MERAAAEKAAKDQQEQFDMMVLTDAVAKYHQYGEKRGSKRVTSIQVEGLEWWDINVGSEIVKAHSRLVKAGLMEERYYKNCWGHSDFYLTDAGIERAAQAAQECIDCGKRYHTLATHECYSCHAPLCADCYERNGQLCCTCSANVDLYDAERDAAYDARIYQEEREEYQRLEWEVQEAERREIEREEPIMARHDTGPRLYREPLAERVREVM
jgi:hypothetical protein